MTAFEVGQTVLVTARNQRPGVEERVVTKVARKYVYIEEFGQLVAFDKSTGSERSNYMSRTLFTPDQWEEVKRGRRLRDLLRTQHGVEFDHWKGRRHSADTLAAVLDLLDKDNPEERS